VEVRESVSTHVLPLVLVLPSYFWQTEVRETERRSTPVVGKLGNITVGTLVGNCKENWGNLLGKPL
jgi:hypothetical protein